jgi:protein tyrosine phosphatase (PTP) superfamily phosphohydrolase (DUF442 family)
MRAILAARDAPRHPWRGARARAKGAARRPRLADLGSIAPEGTAPRATARDWAHALLADHALFRTGWRNWGVVAPGRLYRSNHPLPWQLREAARKHRIRSVINLRGFRPDSGADVLSRAEAHAIGLLHHDAPFESRGAPHRERVLRLAELFSRVEEPVLIHCKSGADRTGLAAGIWLLLQGRPVAEALAQLSLRHGHLRQSKTGILDAFFALYAAQGDGRAFLDWVREGYDPAALRRGFASAGWADALMERVLRRE